MGKFLWYVNYISIKNKNVARHQWLTPIILATWEGKIQRILVQGQSQKIA
jgi:hypothetical protein